jgi:methionyl-tRNA synthetase
LKTCEQHKCCFRSRADDCPICAECGAPAHLLNENCVNCWCCENDEGFIRVGRSKRELEALQKKSEKIFEVLNEATSR